MSVLQREQMLRPCRRHNICREDDESKHLVVVDRGLSGKNKLRVWSKRLGKKFWTTDLLGWWRRFSHIRHCQGKTWEVSYIPFNAIHVSDSDNDPLVCATWPAISEPSSFAMVNSVKAYTLDDIVWFPFIGLKPVENSPTHTEPPDEVLKIIHSIERGYLSRVSLECR